MTGSTDDNSLAQRKSVRFDHNGQIAVLCVFLRAFKVVESPVCRSRYAVPCHKLFGESLACLQHSGFFDRTESLDSPFRQKVHKSARQRVVRRDKYQIDAVFDTEIENSLKIHRRNGRTGRAFGNPRVSRQAEQFVKQRTFFQFKRNSVLPAAASDNSYVYFFHFVPVNA